MTLQPVRRITLCADDYGISPAVNRGIRALIAQRRLNATSVMVVGPATDRDEIAALREVADASGCAVGLHLTLTAPFSPLTMHFRPLDGGAFLSHGRMLLEGLLHRLDREMIEAEARAQFARFGDLLGRAPDYVDGHQHVHLFPVVSEAVVDVVRTAAPGAWARQCGRAVPQIVPLKALLLDLLSRRFRRLCDAAGVACNPAFAGAYDFAADKDFAALVPGFLAGLPDQGLMMCHPGFVDDILVELDSLTTQRERELAYLAGDQFSAMLQAQGITLAATAPTKN